jgi:hypothetical protein
VAEDVVVGADAADPGLVGKLVEPERGTVPDSNDLDDNGAR